MKGPPGVGKTAIVRLIRDQLSAKYGEEFGIVEESPATRDAPDYGGFMMPVKGDDGQPTAFYTRPAAAPTAKYLEAHPRGIIFLDEFSQSDQLVQKALSKTIDERKLGNVTLPDGWWVVMASNRLQDGAGVVRELTHNVNRVCTIQIEPDVGCWATWAETQGLHPMYIAFAKQKPGVVFSETVPKHGDPFCTPRSFVRAGTFHARLAGVDRHGNANMELPADSATLQCVQGYVGEAAAAEMFAFFKLHEHMPTIEEIKADPLKAKCPERLDAAYCVAQMVTHFAAKDNIDTLWQYTERLPKELQVATAQSLVERTGALLLSSKALTNWMSKNRALINASS